MQRRIHAGDDGSARRRAGGIGTIGARESRAFVAQTIKRGSFDFGVCQSDGVVMLLIAGDEEDVGFPGHESTFTRKYFFMLPCVY